MKWRYLNVLGCTPFYTAGSELLHLDHFSHWAHIIQDVVLREQSSPS